MIAHMAVIGSLSCIDRRRWLALADRHPGRVSVFLLCSNLIGRNSGISAWISIKNSSGLPVEAEFLHIAAQEHILLVEVTTGHSVVLAEFPDYLYLRVNHEKPGRPDFISVAMPSTYFCR